MTSSLLINYIKLDIFSEYENTIYNKPLYLVLIHDKQRVKTEKCNYINKLATWDGIIMMEKIDGHDHIYFELRDQNHDEWIASGCLNLSKTFDNEDKIREIPLYIEGKICGNLSFSLMCN